MRKVRRTKLVVETERLLVVRSRRSVSAWCEGCGAATRMVGLDEATALGGLSQREIVRRVEAGAIHFTETEGGVLRVCLNSLLAQASAKGKRDGA